MMNGTHWFWLCFLFCFRHSEYVAELFFLQNNGNMMEYPTWRKKSNTQQFINFMKSHRLEPPPLEEPEERSRQVCGVGFISIFFKFLVYYFIDDALYIEPTIQGSVFSFNSFLPYNALIRTVNKRLSIQLFHTTETNFFRWFELFKLIEKQIHFPSVYENYKLVHKTLVMFSRWCFSINENIHKKLSNVDPAPIIMFTKSNQLKNSSQRNFNVILDSTNKFASWSWNKDSGRWCNTGGRINNATSCCCST